MTSTFQWRISKYDPAYRDAAGAYRRADWVAHADIGGVYDGVVFVRDAYLAVEAAYVDAAVAFVDEAGGAPLFARDVEVHDAALGPAAEGVATVAPAEGAPIAAAQLPGLVRACLREQLWCRLESEKRDTFLHFGYDYYLYAGSPVPCPHAAARARGRGLFVEAVRSPHTVDDGDDPASLG